MPNIDFYILDDNADQARFMTACRLADKAYGKGMQLYVHTDSSAQAKKLDDLLWTFREGSFIPHTTLPRPDDDPSPITIGHGNGPDKDVPLMINLASDVPAFYDRFERILEIIDGDAQRRQQGRARYKHYKDAGQPLTDHRI